MSDLAMQAEALRRGPLRLLIVEDADDDAQLLLREIRLGGFEVEYRRVDSAGAMQAALRDETWDAIACDYVIPGFGGPAALEVLRQAGIDVPLVVVSGHVGEEAAVEMMKAGAHDIVLKSNLGRLVPVLGRELRDAQARRRARLAQSILEESEARYHGLARVSPVGIFLTDAQGHCLYVNERWSELSGLTPEQAAAGWEQVIHPHDRALVSAAWYRSAASRRPFELEYRFLRADGTIVWLLGRAEPVQGDSGEIASYVGSITDITALKLAEGALRERVKEQRCLFCVSDLSSRPLVTTEELLAGAVPLIGAAFQYASFTAVRIRHGGRDYCSADFAESRWRICSALRVAGVEEGSIEVFYLEGRPDAAEGPFLDEEVAMLATVADTLAASIAAKRAHEAVRRSEESLREAQRVGRLGSWTLEISSGAVAWSDELYRIFGLDPRLPPPTLQDQPPLYLPESWARISAALDQAAQTGEPCEMDAEILSPHGRKWIAIRIETLQGADGRVNGLRGTAMDITGRKLAEETIRGSEERLRTIFTRAKDLIYTIGSDGRFLSISPAFEAITGWKPEEWIGRDFLTLVHPEDRQRERDIFKEVCRDQRWRQFEMRIANRAGTYWDGDFSVGPLGLGGASVLFGIGRDVTERKRMEDRLRLANAVVEKSPTVLYRVRGVDASGTVEYVSENFRQFGHEAQDLVSGRIKYLDLVHPDDRQRFLEPPGLADPAQDRSVLQYRLITAAGEARWVEDDILYERDGSGLRVALQGVLRDVTERTAQEQKIARLDRIRAVLSGINTAIVRVREESELLQETCRVAVQQGKFAMAWIGMYDPKTGDVQPAAWLGRSEEYLDAIAPCLSHTACAALFDEVRTTARPLVNNVLKAQSGPLFDAAIHCGFASQVLFPIVVGGQTVGVLGLYSAEAGFFDDEEMMLLGELAGDVGFGLNHIQKEHQVNYLALYDPLTGLANRTLFQERIGQQMRQTGKEVGAVILLDVERFQDINDSLGWAAGDQLLRAVADRLKAAVGEQNLARMDADCFALGIGHEESASGVRRVLDGALDGCFGPSFTVAGKELRLSARCGVALFPADGGDADTLHKHAAVALKKAMDVGETIVFYASEMNARVAARVTLESRLHQALEQRQFELYYQPKYESRSRALTGLEALIRWNDPERGLVSPADFIPLLEETRLILPVGRWALEQAVRQHREWEKAGLAAPRIAVNVSAIQLRQPDFVSMVLGIVNPSRSAGGLDLEITESLIMKDIGGNIAKLQTLRDAGVRTAIDDFGTGYSSLAYIAKLPVDTLKIDRSFVVAMPDSPDDMGIISAIVGLAHQLDLKVVAEGVDSEEQANLLRLLKCDQMQGYLFGKPMPANEVQKLIPAHVLDTVA